MIHIKNKKIKFEDIVTVLILCLVIVQSGSLQFSLAFIEENMQSKICAIILLGVLLPFFVIEFRRLSKVYLISFLALFYFLCVDYFVYPESLLSLLMRVLWFFGFLGFCEYKKQRGNNIFKIFSEIIVILALIAIVLWTAISIFDLKKIGFDVMDTGGKFPYYNWHGIFGYTDFYQIDILGIKAYRLQGMFWEPGVYQFYLNLAIYYFLFESKPERNISKLILLYTNLALTMSTTGLCIGFLLLGVYIINTPIFKKYKKYVISITALSVGAASGYVVYVKFMESVHNTGRGSMYTRIGDLLVGLKLFLNNFLFGAGYHNVELFQETQGWDRGSSNGFLSWAYMMGIVGIIVVLYPFIMNILKAGTKETRIKRMLLFIIFILCNFSEPLYWAPLNWLWLASEYIKLNRINKNELCESEYMPELF